MYVRGFISFFLALFFVGCFALSAKAFVITVADSDDLDQIFSAHPIPQKIIEYVDYTADAFLSRDEFNYLTELYPQAAFSNKSLKKACVYLFAKKKFKHIVINIDETESGYRIFFTLTAYWTFCKVTVTGILFGKDRYAALYGMNNGEHFEELKHNHAVRKLLEVLRNDGYLEAKIQSFFTYDYNTKAISVRLHIIRGKQFKCGGVDIIVTGDDNASPDEPFLGNVLRSLFARKLSKSSYQKGKLERIANQMILYLEQEGYVQSTINVTEKICYTSKEVTIVYTVSIGSYRQFIFFGNSFFSRKALLNNIMELGKSAWLVPASLLAQELAQAYKDKGFLHSTVETQEEKNKCIFLIKEGTRVAVSDIEIKHCAAYTSDYLVKNFFKQTMKKKYFDYDVFHKERNDLCDFYIKNGYLDVQLFEYTFADISHKQSSLALFLDEGNRYTVTTMMVKGCDNALQLPPLQQGPTYLTNSFIIEQREKVQKQCKTIMNREYSVRPEIKKNDGSSVTLEWNVRPMYVPKNFGKTVLMAAVDIPFKNIMKEHLFAPDMQWDNTLLRSTFTNFKSLNVFDTVFLSPQKLKITTEAPDDDYVALQLQYDDPYELRLRTGFELKNVSYGRFLGEGLGYKLGGTFIVKNFLKKCSVVRCNVDLTRFHHEIEAECRYPWIFDMPLRGVAKGYITKYDQPAFVGSKDTLYTAYNNGLLCALGNRKGLFDWNINFGFDWAKTIIRDDTCDAKGCFLQIARAINFTPSLLNVFIPYFFIEPTIYIDYLDDKMSPSKGALTVASIKSMVPLSSDRKPSYFVKLLIEQSFFWPFKNIIGALRIRFGHIFHKDFSHVMPAQRFYLGGAESLRGYERDMAPPLGVYKEDEKHINIVPKGSKSMVNINIELRFPVFKKWGGVVFHDFGTLGDDFMAHTKTNNMLMTTGLGVRYQTPVGPLRFDIGWKWFRKYHLEKSFGWYLTIGNAF